MSTRQTNLLIEFEGDNYEIGFQHGEHFRERIQELTHRVIEYYRTLAQLTCEDELLNITNKFIPYAEEYSPRIYAELRGISDGAKIDFSRLFFLNCFLDISDLRFPHMREMLKSTARDMFAFQPYLLRSGCTSIGALGKATEKKEVLIGQNYDLSSFYKEHVILMKIKQKKGPSIVMCSFNGILTSGAGINSNGIAIVINNLHSTDWRVGVPFSFIARRVLDQERIGDALHATLAARRSSGANYLIADENLICNVETTATDYEVIFARDGHIAHSNHYLSSRLKKYECTTFFDTFIRVEISDRMLREASGVIGEGVFIDVLKNHVNFPDSICRHPISEDNEEKDELGRTLFSVILFPKERKIKVSMAYPCENKFWVFSLSSG